jgi:hypothetical protein
MAISPALTSPIQYSRAHFMRQMALTLSDLASQGVSAEVRLTPERATVKIAADSGQEVTVKINAASASGGAVSGARGGAVSGAVGGTPGAAVGSAVGGVASFASDFCQGFWSSFKKNLTPSRITRGVIYWTVPPVGMLDLAASALGILILLVGRLTKNFHTAWSGYKLADDGVLEPLLERVFKTLFPD